MTTRFPEMSRLLTLLAACALLVFGLAACGGSDEDPSTTAPPPGAQADSGAADSGGDSGDEDRAGNGGTAGGGPGAGSDAPPDTGEGEGSTGNNAAKVDLRVRPASIRKARVTKTGAVQTLPVNPQDHATAQENMYGSIRDFGSETEGEEATNVTFALVQYLDAKARGDWETACARIYSVLRKNLEAEGRSCAQTFGSMMSRAAKANRQEQSQIDVSSVRRGEGNRAFVIYKTPATLSADMPMYVEEGVWKVGALEAYALRPEQVG